MEIWPTFVFFLAEVTELLWPNRNVGCGFCVVSLCFPCSSSPAGLVRALRRTFQSESLGPEKFSAACACALGLACARASVRVLLLGRGFALVAARFFLLFLCSRRFSPLPVDAPRFISHIRESASERDPTSRHLGLSLHVHPLLYCWVCLCVAVSDLYRVVGGVSPGLAGRHSELSFLVL